MKAARIAGLMGALALAGCATPAENVAPREAPAPVVAPEDPATAPAAEAPRVPGQVDALPARPGGSPEAGRVPGRATPVSPPAETSPSGQAAPEAPRAEQPRGAKTADARPQSAPAQRASAPAAPKAPKTAVTEQAKPPAKVATAAAQKEPARKNGPAAPATQPKTPPLDIKALENRLRETDAIGVMTKLTLKSQVDDLLERFRDYHEGRAKLQLAELRQPYDSLILKVLALLQDKDPPLAGAIAASREAIWSILTDGAQFSKL